MVQYKGIPFLHLKYSENVNTIQKKGYIKIVQKVKKTLVRTGVQHNIMKPAAG